MSKQFKKIAVNTLVYVLQGLYFIGHFLITKSYNLVLRPFYTISKKLFGKTFIRLYGWQIIIKNKLHLNKKIRFANWLTSSEITHTTIIVVTIIVLVINVVLSSKNTFAAGDATPKPALFSLINSEFAEDEELIVETFSESMIVTELEENYLQNLASVKVQPQVEMKSLDAQKAEDTESIVQGGGTLVKPNLTKTKKVKRARKTIVYHTIKPGETISTIAQEYDISASTILWENDLNAYSIIRPGKSLAILPVTGISYKIKSGDTLISIANKYDVEQNVITTQNNLRNGYLRAGQTIIIPEGRKKYTTPTRSSYSGLAALRNIIAPPSATAIQGNKMNWPTVGHRITQYYTWRHHALDIANKIGTPIYAADAGTVEYAGWGTGYGNQIVINHGGGKKTRYAHNSKHFVKKGDKVTKGQTIAAMGSTGWSTGSHIHFEIIINGVKYNPLDYIK